MKTKKYIVIATVTVALTAAAFAQEKSRNFETQNIKSQRNVAAGKSSQIKSPRDAASGQATGRRKAPGTRGALLEFQIPEKIKASTSPIISPRDSASGQATGNANERVKNKAVTKQKAVNSTDHNLGDTGTHEVGHRGKRPDAAKYDGIDGESINDHRNNQSGQRQSNYSTDPGMNFPGSRIGEPRANPDKTINVPNSGASKGNKARKPKP